MALDMGSRRLRRKGKVIRHAHKAATTLSAAMAALLVTLHLILQAVSLALRPTAAVAAALVAPLLPSVPVAALRPAGCKTIWMAAWLHTGEHY
jgi:hypothetical protein